MNMHVPVSTSGGSLPFDTEEFALSMAWHARNHADAANQWLRGELLALSR